MLRYYVIATAIVLTVVVLATAWGNRDRIRQAVTSQASPPATYDASATPHGGFEAAAGRSGNEPLTGDAPWALSALPDCLIQRSEATGPVWYVHAKLPRGATPVPSGSVLHYGPCTIFVRGGEVVVSRGADRLRIPPRVTLYRTGEALALLRISGDHGDLRIYTPPRNNQ